MSDPSGPIESKHVAVMNNLARELDERFNGKAGRKDAEVGFALLVFDLNSTEGRMNWISNAEREGMMAALKEFIAKHDGRYQEGGRA